MPSVKKTGFRQLSGGSTNRTVCSVQAPRFSFDYHEHPTRMLLLVGGIANKRDAIIRVYTRTIVLVEGNV